MPCLVLDPDLGLEGPDSHPTAVQHQMKYSMGMQQVQDVVGNARAQAGDLDASRLLAALVHYYTKDAFIDFGKPKG
jgi:hypothetical protein